MAGSETQAFPSTDLGFDSATLRAKYEAERQRRVRQDGNAQYVEIAGKFAHGLCARPGRAGA